jgi:hypothetical protein
VKAEYSRIVVARKVHKVTNLHRFATEARCRIRLVHAFRCRDEKKTCRENGYEIWRRCRRHRPRA